MTPAVDQEARRREIVAVASELVAAQGLDALTVRGVAAAAGASTTILTHYFSDKRDLMLATFRAVADRSGARFDQAQKGGGDLRECLATLLPLDDERQADWRVRTCFYSLCLSDSELAEEETRHVHSAHTRVERMLRTQYPRITRNDVRLAARTLVTVVHGLGARHALDPDSWPASEQYRMLDWELANVARLQPTAPTARGQSPRPHTTAAR
jgi:TetR/AcrR family transcriptional regulator, transcriptional repressor of bet genes